MNEELVPIVRGKPFSLSSYKIYYSFSLENLCKELHSDFDHAKSYACMAEFPKYYMGPGFAIAIIASNFTQSLIDNFNLLFKNIQIHTHPEMALYIDITSDREHRADVYKQSTNSPTEVMLLPVSYSLSNEYSPGAKRLLIYMLSIFVRNTSPTELGGLFLEHRTSVISATNKFHKFMFTSYTSRCGIKLLETLRKVFGNDGVSIEEYLEFNTGSSNGHSLSDTQIDLEIFKQMDIPELMNELEKTRAFYMYIKMGSDYWKMAIDSTLRYSQDKFFKALSMYKKTGELPSDKDF